MLTIDHPVVVHSKEVQRSGGYDGTYRAVP
jgi:hypothetical protein